MKQNWFAGTLGALSLVMGTAWTQTGVAQAISFSPPPGNAAPRSATGGASRGSFFVPPSENASPRETTGGASRSGFFTPPSDTPSPTNSTGGASRGGFFTPPSDSGAPTQGTTGGASRGEFFTPPSDSAAPTQGTTGGASRTVVFSPGQQDAVDAMSPFSLRNRYGDDSVSALAAASMMAITPDSFYGTTLEARPTILVYVPESNAQEAVFSMKDEAKDLVFQMTVAVPAQGGVIAVEMPARAPELAVDANYQWYVAIKLDNELSPASPFVDGWVKRIAPSPELAAALGGEGLADIEALGANGVWYDTAAQLAMLNFVQADNVITGHWYELLESVGLEAVATAPIVM